MNPLRRLAKLTFAMCMLLSMTAQKPAYAAPIFSDFSFGSGVPFGGNTVLAGVGVTLTSTDTEPAGPTAFRDNQGANAAQVQFTFSAPITEFHLDVFAVRADEFLTAFNIGVPTSLSGNLVNQGGLITTSLPFPSDNGSGRLSWVGINTTSITFTIGGPIGTALGVSQFGLPVDSDGDGVPDDEDDCPDSDLSSTVVIAGCDTGVVNELFVADEGLSNGCTISDHVTACIEDARNHGQFVSCVAHLTNDLKGAGVINGRQKGAIQSCAAQADIP